MARIRSIKPELRTSLTVAEWPREVRYFWTLLWGYLDDHGRGVDNARLVLADCFPLDRDLDEDVIDKWLGLFAESGPLCRYGVNGRRYMHSVNWKEHQRPSHPTDSRIPPCPHHHALAAAHAGGFASVSGSSRESLRSDSGSAREVLASSSGSTRETVSAPVTSTNGFANISGGAPELLVPEQVVREVVREVVGGVGGDSVDTSPPEAPKTKRAGKPRTQATEAPERFPVTEPMYERARTVYGLSRQRADFETGQFLDHHRARGNTFKNWESAWNTWMGRVRKYDPSGAQPLPPIAETPAPPHCGRCDPATRLIDSDDGRPYRCPDCHPINQKAVPA